MVALTITKMIVEKFGSDAMIDVLQNLQSYKARINK